MTMKSFLKFTIFCIHVISNTWCSSSYFSKSLCEPEGIADCSFQLPDAGTNSCQVYNSTVCRKFNFDDWSSHSKGKTYFPTTEGSANFSISIAPYAAKYRSHHYFPRSGINITFTSKTDGITGFVLKLPSYMDICKIFDYRSVSQKRRQDVTLFYDCIYISRENVKPYDDTLQNFLLQAAALPSNEQLEYEVYIPSGKELDSDKLCDWKPLIMLLKASLLIGYIELKFSQAPPHFNVTEYNIAVYKASTGSTEKVRSTSVSAQPDSKMIQVNFVDFGYGDYFVSIQYSDNLRKCNEAVTGTFHIEKWRIFQTFQLYLSFILAILGLVCIICYFKIMCSVDPILVIPPKVLIIHSFDFKEHENAVNQLKSVFTAAACPVYVIYGNGDPDQWLTKVYSMADVVVIIISVGVFHKIENKNEPYPMAEKHKWGDRLIPAVNMLQKEVFESDNKKKFVKVLFEHSGQENVPSCMRLKAWGKEFLIPKQLQDLMNHVCSLKSQNCFQSLLKHLPVKLHGFVDKDFDDCLRKAKVEFNRRIKEQQTDVNYPASAFVQRDYAINGVAQNENVEYFTRIASPSSDRNEPSDTADDEIAESEAKKVILNDLEQRSDSRDSSPERELFDIIFSDS